MRTASRGERSGLMAKSIVEINTAGLVFHPPGPSYVSKRLGHREPGLQAVLVEAGPEIGAAEPCMSLSLQRPQLALSLHRGGIEYRMFVIFFVQDLLRCLRRVEGDKQGLRGGKTLQEVHPVGHG